MEWLELCRLITMPAEVVTTLEKTVVGLATEREEELIEKLRTVNYYEAATALKEELVNDPLGLKMLKVLLKAAARSYADYEKAGISEEIYVRTMECYTRYVNEHMVSFGVYGFDKWFWTGRQPALQLFRVGTLEYEICKDEQGERVVHVHVPSTSDLSAATVEASFWQAKEFLRRFYPDYANVDWVCYSWLLSPVLEKFLPPASRILSFAARFERKRYDEDNESYKEWVFKNPFLSPEEFPENTSLQKKMKAYVLAGGKVGSAYGRLK